MKLVEQLVQQQRRDRLTDQQMAARLGLHTVAWKNARRGCRISVIRLARWVARTRPELRKMALAELDARNARGLT